MGLDAIVIRRLRRTELPIDTVELARELVGRVLAHDLPEGRISGRIVETEAYVVGDASGHAFHGPTPRNRLLFLERGHAYVYRAYGISYLLNVSSELPGVGAGVLLRALEPLEGIAAMMRHRGTSRILDLARGPGRLAAAMRIDRRCDGADLCAGGPLWLGAVAQPAGPIDRSVRIGLTLEADRLHGIDPNSSGRNPTEGTCSARASEMLAGVRHLAANGYRSAGRHRALVRTPGGELVKMGAGIVRHGRYVVLQLAEVAVGILRRIELLRPRPQGLRYIRNVTRRGHAR